MPMDKKPKLRKVIYRGALLLLAAAALSAVRPNGLLLLESVRTAVYHTCLPALSFAEKGQVLLSAKVTEEEKGSGENGWKMPLSESRRKEEESDGSRLQQESGNILRQIQEAEGRSEDEESETGAALETDPENAEGKIRIADDLARGLAEENAGSASANGISGDAPSKPQNAGKGATAGKAQEETAFSQSGFKKQETKVQSYEWDYYNTYETLTKEFFAIDRSTSIAEDRLNLETLMGKDMKLTTEGDGPQILIYHTHSQETFADSVPGDESTSIVGVGEYLTQILQEEYGFHVLHHTGQYDVDSRDFAYTNALPAIEQVLQENPSIEVVIDLHRDACDEDTHLVMDVNGRPTARFMFFNGLSHLKKTGDIDSLPNPYIEDNLAFAFQMQVLCNEYYPGLTRRIYLKGYRYNMHLRPKSLLIELGAQTNTVEEAMNACEPLAQMLALELWGEETEGD